MRGRFVSLLRAGALARTFGAENLLPSLEPFWNVTPTQSAEVVRRHPEMGGRRLDLMQWGSSRWG
ncbi:MAG TPA: SOS response-associated peptidase family protein [Acetobacteraceae bacterium]|nr:SOS response-associated peptidase family protein [Acetobacteraceae bacterium]